MKQEIIVDEFGPQYVVEVNSLKPKFKGFLVIDNLALGPGKGGIRMAENLTVFELFRLARTMTWKNAIFDLGFGGAKSGILIDPKKVSLKEKEAIIQSFAKSLAPFVPKYYIAGPDIGTGEQEMKWFSRALGTWQVCTGKPGNFCQTRNSKVSCGLPHELGSTGFGVAQATKVASEFKDINLKGASVAIAGFGNVGSFAAKFLQELGAKIVAIADREGTILNWKGLPVQKLSQLKKKKRLLTDYRPAQSLPLATVYRLPVDILIPAAVSDVINEKNWRQVKAKIIVEGANIPIPENIEQKLERKGIMIVPDFVANGGGVISSYVEYHSGSVKQMFEIVGNKIKQATSRVLTETLRTKRNPRQVALVIAKEKVKKVMSKT